MTVTVTANPPLYVVALNPCFILDQLRLEEALLRADERNWCLLNTGSSRAIVLGISGQLGKLVRQERLASHPIPLIRRFTGGGTVVVDADTLFVTLIMNRKDLPHVNCYPEPILKWTESLYRPLLPPPAFKRLENDYTIDGRKFGGNAQYLSKDRWLHHSSLLWDYDEGLMDYLLVPERQPNYRVDRQHTDFLCRLRPYLPRKELFFDRFVQQLKTCFSIHLTPETEAFSIMKKNHRCHTHML